MSHQVPPLISQTKGLHPSVTHTLLGHRRKEGLSSLSQIALAQGRRGHMALAQAAPRRPGQAQRGLTSEDTDRIPPSPQPKPTLTQHGHRTLLILSRFRLSWFQKTPRFPTTHTHSAQRCVVAVVRRQGEGENREDGHGPQSLVWNVPSKPPNPKPLVPRLAQGQSLMKFQ